MYQQYTQGEGGYSNKHGITILSFDQDLMTKWMVTHIELININIIIILIIILDNRASLTWKQ